jgi:hypothetical protein
MDIDELIQRLETVRDEYGSYVRVLVAPRPFRSTVSEIDVEVDTPGQADRVVLW